MFESLFAISLFFLTKANLHGKIVIGIGTKKILLIFFSANG